MWLTEKANLPPPPALLSSSRLIRVPLPTPEGPHMTSAAGLGALLVASGAASAAAGVDCSAPMSVFPWPAAENPLELCYAQHSCDLMSILCSYE